METGNVYRVKIDKRCAKQINKYPANIHKAVEIALNQLSIQPHSGKHIKQLKGALSGYHRYAIAGFRLVYQIFEQEIIVEAVYFGPRGDVYKHI